MSNLRRVIRASLSETSLGAEADELYQQAKAERERLLPIMHREAQRLTDLGFRVYPINSVVMGLNLPAGQGDVDLSIASDDPASTSAALEELGIPLNKKHGSDLFVHKFMTPESVKVDVSVSPTKKVEARLVTLGHISGLDDLTKEKLTLRKERLFLSGNRASYKAAKRRIYRKYR